MFYEDEDYVFYLEKPKNACEKYGCQLHAYVLMTNHVHLLLTPKTGHWDAILFRMFHLHMWRTVNRWR